MRYIIEKNGNKDIITTNDITIWVVTMMIIMMMMMMMIMIMIMMMIMMMMTYIPASILLTSINPLPATCIALEMREAASASPSALMIAAFLS